MGGGNGVMLQLQALKQICFSTFDVLVIKDTYYVIKMQQI